MQMQQQQTQQMRMNFVQAQQQQSQLLMHFLKNILNDCLLASKFLGIESDIYNFCCDANVNILLVLIPLFTLVYVIMYIHEAIYLFIFSPLLSYKICHINNIKQNMLYIYPLFLYLNN